MDITPFVDAAAASATTLLRYQPVEVTADAWRRELTDEIKTRMHSLEHLKAYAQDCPVSGAKPVDYRLRQISLGKDGSFLAGIHFLGLDVNRPFVGVLAREHALTDAAYVRRVSKALASHFSLFSPEAVWFFQPDGAPELDLASYPGSRLDQHLLAAPVREMLTRSPQHLDRVEARAITEGWYRRYTEAFARFRAANPKRGYLNMEKESDLIGCEEGGALRELFVDGKWAGLIAAGVDRQAGLTGHSVWDVLLDTPWRGKGLAAACHRRFLEHLPPDTLLWGTVDARNTPSRRAAQGAGRVIVGRWWFIPPGA